MDEIAARAGITKRALYQHLRGKDDLMAMTLAHSSKRQSAVACVSTGWRAWRVHRRVLRRPLGMGGEAELVGRRVPRVVVELADFRGHSGSRYRAGSSARS